MNIHAIVKRIGEKADASDVKEAVDTSNMRIDGLEATFVQILNDIENVNRQQQIQSHFITELANKQQEVSIGKRNINCLSCTPDVNMEEKQMGKDGKLYRVQSINDVDQFQIQDYLNTSMPLIEQSKRSSRT